MTPTAIFFGSIGTLADTSDIQRRAFNAAFEEAGLDWHWAPDAYRAMLRRPGGASRIARYAESRGEQVDAAMLHAAKVGHFERIVRDEGMTPRPGVTALIAAAVERDLRLGLVTATTPRTVRLMLEGLEAYLPSQVFDVVTDGTMAAAGKPAPDIYNHALNMVALPARTVLAIEDTPEAAQAAIAAGIPTLAFPNAAAAGRAFPGTVGQRATLDAGLVSFDLSRAA